MAEKTTFDCSANLITSFAGVGDSNTKDVEPFVVANDDEEENEDPTVCEICLDGEVYEENEIIFCDKCNVPVHQLCYSVPVVPEGSWFCYPCSAALDPTVLACELCSNTGGAYKLSDKGKWVHPLCASWVPEIYEITQPNVKLPMLNLVNLDKKRFKLKCALCTGKGACIQCCYGRCTTAAHPWCVLKNSQGFTRRIVKNEDGHMIWEVFCKTHAKAVSEPLKPKPKSKTSVYLSLPEDEVVERGAVEQQVAEDPYSVEDKYVSTKKAYKARQIDYDSNGKRALSMAHAKQFGNSHLLLHKDSMEQQQAPLVLFDEEQADVTSSVRVNGKSSKSTMGGKSNGSFSSSSSSSAGKNGIGRRSGADGDGSSSSSSKAQSFPVLNLMEWPGQSEGEAMDLEHYWNVVSSFYPEDHSGQWLDFMASSFLQGPQDDDRLDPLYDMPALGAPSGDELRDLAELCEDKLMLLGGEREKNALFDVDKRSTLLGQISGRLQQLSHETGGKQLESLILDENTYYTHELGLHPPVEMEEEVDEEGLLILRAVFDGGRRVGCEFKVDFPTTEGNVSLVPSNAVDYEQWIGHNLIPLSGKPLVLDNGLSQLSIAESSASIRLETFSVISPTTEVLLPDRSVIPRDQDNILCRVIRTDQVAHRRLVEAVHRTAVTLFEAQKMQEQADKYSAHAVEWDAVNDRYQKQQIWKQVCGSLNRGVRDQMADFNRVEPESVPASWSIQVDGRPPVAKEEEAEPEVHEDAVCMCCFDGKSYENNPILFCDGCNATLHQTCYGVAEIPEGDFFCDRCRYIQLRAADPEEADWQYNDGDLKGAVMCCLCPLFHGGFKATSDGRWVHLSCAMWSGKAIIRDLVEMGPVDVTAVGVQEPSETAETRKGRKSIKPLVPGESSPRAVVDLSVSDVPTTACKYCNVMGGFVVQCCRDETVTTTTEEGCSGSVRCSAVFHPLCAWFDGAYMCSVITDRTYQSVERDGLYPSGITFEFVCDAHDASARPSTAIKAEQQTLRCKYRIREEDLEQIPERNRRKRKKPKVKKASGGGGGERGTSAGSQVIKDLNPDVYDELTCAVCLEPTTEDVFSCGFDPKVFADLDTWAMTGLPDEEEDAIPSSSSSSSSSTANPVVQVPSLEQSTVDLMTVGEVDNQTFAEGLANGGLFGLSPSPHVGHSSSSAATTPVILDVKPKIASFATNSGMDAWAAALTDRSSIVKCRKCSLSVHRCCFLQCLPCGAGMTASNDVDFLCDTCAITTPEETDVRCVLCPRRGGFLKRTNEENRWVHAYCALKSTTPGVVQFDGTLDVRNATKEMRKVKCLICNRKGGVAVRCNFLGCTSHFHPICGVRSGRALIRNRQGAKQVLCFDHLPEGVERLPSGYWVDGYELVRFRYCLDRARLILDILLRREKYKKMLCKVELEWFNSRYSRMVDKALGKKSAGGDDALTGLSDDDVSCSESESEAEDENDEDQFYGVDGAPKKAGRSVLDGDNEFLSDDFKPIESVQYGSPSKEVRVELGSGEQGVLISATWTKRGEVRLPKKVTMTFAGLEVTRKDAQREGGHKAFTKDSKEQLVRNTDLHRGSTQLFASQREENDFARKLGPSLLRHMWQPNEQFRVEMEKLGIKVIFEVVKKVAALGAISSKKVKKGYVLLAEEAAASAAPQRASSAAVSMAIASASKVGRKRLQLHEEEDAVEEVVLSSTTGKGRGRQSAPPPLPDLAPFAPTSTKKGKGRALTVESPIAAPMDVEAAPLESPVVYHRIKKKARLVEEEEEEEVAPVSTHKKGSKERHSIVQEKDLVISIKGIKGRQQRPEEEVIVPKKGEKNRLQLQPEEDLPAPKKGVSKAVVPPVSSSKKQLQQLQSPPSSPVPAASASHKKRKTVHTAVVDLVAEQTTNTDLVPSTVLYPPTVSNYYSRGQLEKLLEADALGKELLKKFPCNLCHRAFGIDKASNGEYDAFLIDVTAMIQAQLGGSTSSSSDGSGEGDELLADWRVFGDHDMYRLERRIQDILNEVEFYMVPDEGDGSDSQTAIVPSTPQASKAVSRRSTPGSKKGGSPRGGASAPIEEETVPSSSSSSVAMRELAAEFGEVPYDVIPDYNEYVRKALTIGQLRINLKTHEYRSMAGFSKDFYSLLNNARSVTPQNSPIWEDSLLLAKVFEDAKTRSLTVSYSSRPKGKEVQMALLSAENSGSDSGEGEDRRVEECSTCRQKHQVVNWPSDFVIGSPYQPPPEVPPEGEAAPADVVDLLLGYESNDWAVTQFSASGSSDFQFPEDHKFNRKLSLEKRRAVESYFRRQWQDAVDGTARQSWQWLCASCVGRSGRRLIGKEVCVWWHDDLKAYRGVVNAFDEASGSHRVLYDDEEWEFVNLTAEPFVLYPSLPHIEEVVADVLSVSSSAGNKKSTPSKSTSNKVVKSHKKIKPPSADLLEEVADENFEELPATQASTTSSSTRSSAVPASSSNSSSRARRSMG